jgi:hypothetical protein
MHVKKTSHWDKIIMERGVIYLVIKLKLLICLKTLKFPIVYISQISL